MPDGVQEVVGHVTLGTDNPGVVCADVVDHQALVVRSRPAPRFRIRWRRSEAPWSRSGESRTRASTNRSPREVGPHRDIGPESNPGGVEQQLDKLIRQLSFGPGKKYPSSTKGSPNPSNDAVRISPSFATMTCPGKAPGPPGTWSAGSQGPKGS